MKAMLFEKLIDRKDRKKIRRRTRNYGQEFDFRLEIKGSEEKEKTVFLVVGDSGAGGEEKPMKYHVAHSMAKEENVDLILHVGDMVYLSGAKQGYPLRFIKTYQNWLVRGSAHSYRNMVFNKPFLPIYGNHDYYDFNRAFPIVGHIAGMISKSIGSGSKNGKIFERAFIESDNSRLVNGVLPYEIGKHTRIPNRYYWFIQGACAFFALDSNTLDTVREPTKSEKKQIRIELEKLEQDLELGRKRLEKMLKKFKVGAIQNVDQSSVDQFIDKITDLEKRAALYKKRLDADLRDHDSAQLDWLEHALQHEDVKGKWKVVYMHHSMYSSEGGHVDDIATGGLRENLRRIFARHEVNLVLSGHSHCFEWVGRKQAGSYDNESAVQLIRQEQSICYIVTGGGGQNLRESVFQDNQEKDNQNLFSNVAVSKAYTAKFKDNELENNIRYVHNYVRIEADKNTLKVFPQAVSELNEQPHHLPSFPTLVFTEKNNRVEAKQKVLHSIEVFRDKPPTAQWNEEVSP